MRHYKLSLNNKDFDVRLCSLSSEAATLEINGHEYQVSISEVSEIIQESEASNMFSTSAPAATVAAPKSSPSGSDGAVLAPIPGSIMDVYVKVGDTVKAGQPLFKMEAMKMENEINARIDGTIAVVNIGAGDTVNQGDELILMTP